MASRREVILGSVGFGLLAFTGCSVSATSLQNDAQIAEGALEAISSAIALIKPSWLSQYQTDANIASGVLTSIANNSSTPNVALVISGVKAIESIYTQVSGSKLPATVIDAATALESLTPVFEAAVGLTAAVKINKHKYTVEEARNKLSIYRNLSAG